MAASNRGLVLVVDDAPSTRWVLEQILGQAGFETHSVENGAEALSYLMLSLEHLPSAIVLDLSMPIMNGWQFLNHRKQNAALLEVPVVLFSSDALVSEEQVRKSNVIAFVSKTEPKTKLLSAVEEAVQLKQQNA